MTTYILDEAVKQEIDALTPQEIDASESYAYSHEILWYGVETVAHIHMMHKAQEILNGDISLDDFISQYNIVFRTAMGGFSVPLMKIADDGVFIPKSAYLRSKEPTEKSIHLFERDYLNRIMRKEWIDKDYALILIDRRWQAQDLQNPQLIEQGLRFGKDIWTTCVEGFHLWKNGDHFNNTLPQSQKVTEAGEKLIAYYSGIINNE